MSAFLAGDSSMSVLDHKRTFLEVGAMSALPPIADIVGRNAEPILRGADAKFAEVANASIASVPV